SARRPKGNSCRRRFRDSLDSQRKGGTMGLLRNRGPEGTPYTMREKMFSIGDDFWIEKEGERAFKVDGKALRVRETFVLEGPSGDELYTIQERKLSVRDKMAIERDGQTVATIKKALISPLRERYSIEVEGGDDMEAKGNIVDHEFEIKRAATRSRRSRSGGSGCAIPTVSRSRRDRTTRSSSRAPSASTRWADPARSCYAVERTFFDTTSIVFFMSAVGL